MQIFLLLGIYQVYDIWVKSIWKFKVFLIRFKIYEFYFVIAMYNETKQPFFNKKNNKKYEKIIKKWNWRKPIF